MSSSRPGNSGPVRRRATPAGAGPPLARDAHQHADEGVVEVVQLVEAHAPPLGQAEHGGKCVPGLALAPAGAAPGVVPPDLPR